MEMFRTYEGAICNMNDSTIIPFYLKKLLVTLVKCLIETDLLAEAVNHSLKA